MKILNSSYDSKFKEIVAIHNITKHYILLGEEIDRNFNSYVQPLKEFRDSYDHILRIFKLVLFKAENNNSVNYDIYIKNQLSKALGHEYRAFFDVADWFSIICRDVAYSSIENRKNNIDEIIKQCPKYVEYTEYIDESCIKIAELRENKDVADNIVDTVNEYQQVLVRLMEAALNIRKAALKTDSK